MNSKTHFFTFQERQIKIMIICGQPFFYAEDVAAVLCYDHWEEYLPKLCRGMIQHPVMDTNGMESHVLLLPERDLYRLIFHSDYRFVNEFEDCVVSELNSLEKKQVFYVLHQMTDSIIDIPKHGNQLLEQIKDEQQKVRLAEDTINRLMHTEKTYSTSELAKELGFISAKKFNEFLHDQKVLFRSNGTWLPYSQYADKEIILIKQGFLPGGIVTYQSRWTQKGRKFLLELLEKSDTGKSITQNL